MRSNFLSHSENPGQNVHERRIFANCGFAAVFCATSDTRGENLRCCSQRLSEEEEELESGPELLLVKLNCSVRPLEGFLGAEWRDECLADGPSSHARVGCPGPSLGAVVRRDRLRRRREAPS